MTWMLLDSAGNAIAGYGDVVAAHAALRSLVEEEPGAAEHVLLFAYDDDGNPIGTAVTFDDLPESTVGLFGANVVVHMTATCTFSGTSSFRPAELLTSGRARITTSAGVPA